MNYRVAYMKTKKALAGLLGLFGSFAAFFDALVPAPAPFLFSLINKQYHNQKPQKAAKNHEHRS